MIVKMTKHKQYELDIAVDLWESCGILKDGFTLDEDGEVWFCEEYA